MNDLIVIALVIVACVLMFNFIVRLPPRRATLNNRAPGKAFHGLVLFGDDHSYVEFDQKGTGDRIIFEKKYKEGNNWIIEVITHSVNLPESFVGDVRSSLAVLGKDIEIKSRVEERDHQSKFSIVGPGLKDHHVLESLARIVVRCLKHPENYKYRVEFKGPKDYRAVDNYFSKEQKKWKGE